MWRILCLAVVSIYIISTTAAHPLFAQDSPPVEQRFEARVDKILEEYDQELNGTTHKYQKLLLLKDDGERIVVDNGNIVLSNPQNYQIGQEVVVLENIDLDGNKIYFITDYVRRAPLGYLFILFLAFVLFIGKKSGFRSVIGMGASFLIIFYMLLPLISRGFNPVFVSLVAALFMIPITFFLSHGISRKTIIAVIGTFLSLVITAILAFIFINFAKLSGFSSDEAAFLQSAKGSLINIQGLLLAGIIVAALGILDDITISQASIVEELKSTSKNIGFSELYSRGMKIGRDHIASLVNTLVLVYTGASLPLLLLFVDNPRPFAEVINYEIVAEEIVKTLVSSIGIISAVPITTLLAAYIFSKKAIFTSE